MFRDTVDGRNPAPIKRSHEKPLCIGNYRGASFQSFLGGAGFRPQYEGYRDGLGTSTVGFDV